MLFNSPEFAVFLLFVLSIYTLLRSRFRLQNALLLVSSYLFYGWWDVRFLHLIVLSTAVDYTASLMIDRGTISLRRRVLVSLFASGSAAFFVLPSYEIVGSSIYGLTVSFDNALGWWVLGGTVLGVAIANLAYRPATRLSAAARRRVFVTLSLVANLGILGFFKYFNFFDEGFVALAETLLGVTPSTWTLEIILPVGISFYTFQTMSYTLDVYRGDIRASKNFVEVATYVAFFPQLVAGPIERGAHLLPQFRAARERLTRARFNESAWLIAWGLFKKVVVADNMALIVNECFRPYDQLAGPLVVPEDGLTLLVGVYAFAFQIYGDFSGYTEIARGTARLLGFDIMLNFNLPYFATSPSSFWRRWHISLSSWLRDYLYISLGGNRKSSARTYVNLMITMLLGGLWHGAAWNFVLWGAYHGALLVGYRALGLRTEQRDQPWWKSLILGAVMFQLTCYGWLLFRAQNLETIAIFTQSIFLHPHASAQTWTYLARIVEFQWFLLLFQIVQGVTGDLDPMRRWHWFVRLNVWIYVIMSIAALAAGGVQEFIYFDF